MKEFIKKLLREGLLNEYGETAELDYDVIDIPPVIDNDDNGGDDDNENYPYLQEWLDYWKDKEMPPMFGEIWRDEKYRRNLDNYKDTKAFTFYSKLWYEHMYDHPQLKKQIEQEISSYIDHYNDSIYKLDQERQKDKELEDILSIREAKLGGKQVIFKLTKPEKGYVNRYIKNGESEEDANRMLFDLISIEDVYDPDDTPNDPDEWDDWVKTTYKPFIERYVEPFVEENGWRLWSV